MVVWAVCSVLNTQVFLCLEYDKNTLETHSGHHKKHSARAPRAFASMCHSQKSLFQDIPPSANVNSNEYSKNKALVLDRALIRQLKLKQLYLLLSYLPWYTNTQLHRTKPPGHLAEKRIVVVFVTTRIVIVVTVGTSIQASTRKGSAAFWSTWKTGESKKIKKDLKNERLQGRFFYTTVVYSLLLVGRKRPSLSGIGRLRSVLLTSKNHPYFSVKMSMEWQPKKNLDPSCCKWGHDHHPDPHPSACTAASWRKVRKKSLEKIPPNSNWSTAFFSTEAAQQAGTTCQMWAEFLLSPHSRNGEDE